MEKMESESHQDLLSAGELDLAISLFGDLPTEELAPLLFAAYDESEIKQFGSHEAAEAHRVMVAELEAAMIQDLAETEARVRRLQGAWINLHTPRDFHGI